MSFIFLPLPNPISTPSLPPSYYPTATIPSPISFIPPHLEPITPKLPVTGE